MHIISLINLKGGVGKTTTAINMSAELAKRGRRVLLIDADQQHNASDFFGITNRTPSLAEVLGGTAALSAAIVHKGNCGVDVVPSSMALALHDLATIRGDSIKALSLREQIATLPYDLTVIDCPPGFSAASVAALSASDEAIIPTTVDPMAVSGMMELREQIKSLRKINGNIAVEVLITIFDRQNAADRQGADQLRAQKSIDVFAQSIRHSTKVKQASFRRQTLTVFSPGCGAAVDYRRFVDEWEKRHDVKGETHG